MRVWPFTQPEWEEGEPVPLRTPGSLHAVSERLHLGWGREACADRTTRGVPLAFRQASNEAGGGIRGAHVLYDGEDTALALVGLVVVKRFPTR